MNPISNLKKQETSAETITGERRKKNCFEDSVTDQRLRVSLADGLIAVSVEKSQQNKRLLTPKCLMIAVIVLFRRQKALLGGKSANGKIRINRILDVGD